MPKVSVIIPTYNCGLLLKESIHSVLAQSLKDFELIIVDDGSTDNTKLVIKNIGDSRIQYFYKGNGGASSARNIGLTKATGQYVAFLDADDSWPNDYLKIMTSVLDDSSEYGVAYSTVTQVWPDGKRTEFFKLKHCVSGWIAADLFNKFFVLPQTTVCRRTILQDFRFDESLKTADDYDGFLRLSLKAKFLFISKTQTIRTVRSDSLTAQASPTAIGCNKIRVLERFYYQLNGKEHISKIKALHRIGRCYNRTAKDYYKDGARKAAIYMFKKAILYNPFVVRPYWGLLRAVLISKYADEIPQWQMLEALQEVKSSV